MKNFKKKTTEGPNISLITVKIFSYGLGWHERKRTNVEIIERLVDIASETKISHNSLTFFDKNISCFYVSMDDVALFQIN